MKRNLLCVAVSLASLAVQAVGTVYVTLSYVWNGIPKQDTIVLGVGGKQEPDYYENANIGQFDYSFNSKTGLDLRLGIDRGNNNFLVGRQDVGSFRYLYYPKGGSNPRLNFGETYELDLSRDWSITNQLTDVVISTTPFGGKKITNMTGSTITLNLGWGGSQFYMVPNNSAIISPDIVTTFAYGNYDTSWECHSEQDWSDTFSPDTYKTVRRDFPQFANLVFYKQGSKPTIHDLNGALVFGDMKPSSEANILYGASGYPLYSIRDYLDSVTVMTEWIFDQSQIPSPDAYINNVVVCAGHATTHIIDYKISSTDNWTYNSQTQTYYIDFTMRLTGSSQVSSPSVVQRCWNNKYSTYDDAPATERASKSGVLGDYATFRLSQNIVNNELTIELLEW